MEALAQNLELPIEKIHRRGQGVVMWSIVNSAFLLGLLIYNFNLIIEFQRLEIDIVTLSLLGLSMSSGWIALSAMRFQAALKIDSSGVYSLINGVGGFFGWSDIGGVRIKILPQGRLTAHLLYIWRKSEPSNGGVRMWTGGISAEKLKEVVESGIARWGG